MSWMILCPPLLDLERERKDAVSKRIKEVAVISSGYDTEFRTLAAEHEIGIGENFNGKVYFALAYQPYQVQKDEK